MKRLRKKWLSFLAIALLFSFTLSLFPIHKDVSFAQSYKDKVEEYKGTLDEDDLPSSELKKATEGTKTRSAFAEEDEIFYYRLEAILPDEDKAKWYNPLGRSLDKGVELVNEPVLMYNQVFFNINMELSKKVIGFMEMAMQMPYISGGIEVVSERVTKLVGIAGTNFSRSGMFYTVAKAIAILVVVYAFYKLVWSRSVMSSFSELVKFVVVLTTALLLFSNYGTFLSGMNKISEEIGDFIVGSTTDSSFSQTLWTHLIDKPYLTLQYGTDDLEEIGDGSESAGKERIKQLLTSKVGSSTRSAVVDYEVNELKNYYMSYESLSEKTAHNTMFFLINLVTFLPFIVIAFATIFTQFWYLIIAIFAPFALLIASFPSQFNVLKRYFFELMLPLMVKVGLHFALVIIMLLTSLYADFDSKMRSDILDGHIGTAFITALFYLLLFFGIFMLRKRITGMLSSGSEIMEYIRQGMRATTTQPVQSGVQMVGAGIGATAGFTMTGNFKGAAFGANIGTTVGGILSGKAGDIGSTTRQLSDIAYQSELLQRVKNNDDGKEKIKENDNDKLKNNMSNSEKRNKQEPTQQQQTMLPTGLHSLHDEETLTPEQEQAQEYANIVDEDKEEQAEYYLNNLLESGKMNVEQYEEFRKELEELGVDIGKITPEMLERNNLTVYDADSETKKKISEVDPRRYAQLIKQDMNTQELRLQDLRNQRINRFNTFLKAQNLSDFEINDIHKHLKSKNIDVAKIARYDYINADKQIKQRLQAGENISYTEELKKSLTNKALERKIQSEKERVLSSKASTGGFTNFYRETEKMINVPSGSLYEDIEIKSQQQIQMNQDKRLED